MINKVYEDGPLVFPENTMVDVDIKVNLQKYVILCFPNAAMVEEEIIKIEEMGHLWRMMVLMRMVG